MKKSINTSANKIFLCIFAIFLLPAFAFSILMPGWTYFGMKNSLPNDLISSISVAPDGKVWIACQKYQNTGGISVFDGKNWTYFNKEQDGLPSINIISIHIDKKGKVYANFSDTLPYFYEKNLWQPVNMSGLDPVVKFLNPISFDANNRM